MRRTRGARAATIAGVAIGCSFTLTPPASADLAQWDDPAHDMTLVTDDVFPNPIRPGQTNGDVREISIEHRLHNVWITASYTDLEHVAGSGFSLAAIEAQIRTNEWRLPRSASVGISSTGETWDQVHYGPNRDCATSRLDLLANTARIRIPRWCLSHPRWIRVAMTATRSQESFPPMVSYRDYGGVKGDDWRVTQRLFRG